MKLRNSALTIVFLFFATTFFSVNCHAQKLHDDVIRFHKDYTENGLVFGTISFPQIKQRFDGYFLWISCKEDGDISWKSCGKISMRPQMFKAKHNGELDGGKTYIFAMEKPPGQYNITGIRLSILKVGQYVSKDTDVPGFTIPFDVKKGEIIYIGNININEYALKGEELITVDDKFEKDKNSLKNLQKMVNWDAATKSKLEIIRTSY